MLFLIKAIFVLGQSNERPPVLILKGNNGYTTHYDTKNNITSQLINQGIAGQATVEFWVMKGHTHSILSSGVTEEMWKYSNLLPGGEEFTIASLEDGLSIKIGNTTETVNFENANEFWDNEWHHVAITINKVNANLKIYVDGIRRISSNYPRIGFDPERMYMMVTADDQLSVAEYRAWNRVRTADEIEEERFLTFSNTNSTNLQRLSSVGLVTAYADNRQVEQRVSNLPIYQLIWHNILSTDESDSSLYSQVTSSIGDFKIAELSTQVDHPIYSLRDVLLSASDGNGETRAGRRTVYLRWPHIRGGTNYIVARRNLADQASRPSVIGNVTATSQDAISNYLEYFDDETLPNEIYEYTVTAEGVDESEAGIDNGFVFANGIVRGSIETPSRIATQDALLEATVSEGNLPGHAIQFSRGSTPVNINDVTLFQQANGNGTIEFWYRTPTAGAETNTVFKLSEGEIQINGTTVTVLSRDAANPSNLTPITYLSATKPNDNLWHHYAVTFSSTGGALYIDGGIKQPTDRENPVVANTTTSKPFFVGLERTSRFSFNANAESTYELDEIRIWSVKKSVTDIYKYWNFILGNNDEPNLLAYYRLDMNDSHNIYNQAATSLGMFRGTSIQALRTVEQPYVRITEEGTTTNESIKYAVYTNEEGLFRFNSINSGRQSVHSTNTFLTYRVTPSKPNNRFEDTSESVDIGRELLPREPSLITFTNVSQYEISGEIFYKVSNGEGGEKYPSVQNTGIKLDGTEQTSIEEGSLVRTNSQGVFRITGSPDRHTITVGSPRFEVSSIETDRVSLDFKQGANSYAESADNVTEITNQGFTWSGFIKPDIFLPQVGSGNEVVKPEVQTILHWGSLRLELRNNNRLVLLSGTSELLSEAIEEESSTYTFFAITHDATNNVVGFKVNNNYQTASYTSGLIDSKVYFGATFNSNTDITNYSVANMDLLEFRNEYYAPEKLSDIKAGYVIEGDEDNLKLSYTFEHRTGVKAVNLAVNSGTDNNYLDLKQGAYFNNESSSQYVRQFDFDYIASEDSDNASFINPVNNKEYLFNLTEPTSDINFENTTRRSFIGNIVVPCNNDVGNFRGTITRTDIAFPVFTKEITISDFNSENNLFTIHDLLPGQYTVELTRIDTNKTVSSAIIDLRGGNKSYDFPFRNPLQAEVAVYGINETELRALTTNQEFEDKKINQTCGENNSIYNLEQGKNIYIQVSVFEDYNGSRCPVEGATVNLSGDMIVAPVEGTTDVAGRSGALTFTGTPNFLGDYLRRFSVVVDHAIHQSPVTIARTAYVTGSRKGNDNFTLTDPDVGFILYDPPGDGSSSTLSRGSSYSYNYTAEEGSDFSLGTNITTGTDIQTQTVSLAIAAPLGVGTAQGVTNTIISSSTKALGGLSTNVTYRKTNSNSFNISLDQQVSTSSSSTIVGADADVFVGISKVLTFGTGMALSVRNCVPVINQDRNVATTDELTPFIYTRQDIEDNVIRKLQERLIEEHDKLSPPTPEAKASRSSLDYQTTIDGFNIDIANATFSPGAEQTSEEKVVDYLFQINEWKNIVKRKTRAEQLTYFNNETRSFAETTQRLKKDLTVVSPSLTIDDFIRNQEGSNGDQNLGGPVNQIDTQISFSGETSTTYTIARSIEEGVSESSGFNGGISTDFKTSHTIFGVKFNFDSHLEISPTRTNTESATNGNSRVESFTLTDGDAGDQFSVKIARDKIYDTPIFYTVAGQSICPFESGTVPREGVEITVDSTVKYGVGDGSILYNLTLRNTQIANDATRKVYIVGMNGASNNNGAQVFLNESPIFEPATTSPINFGLDGNSPTGVQQEITAQLRITRGLDAPEEISYENIGIRIYSACEQEGDRYRSYGVDEYAEAGVVPFQEIFVTAHFRGACIGEIVADQPAENWVVNGGDKDKLDFRFRIPEISKDAVTVNDTFTVDLEYAIEGNNDPSILKTLSLTELRDNLQVDGFITYSADVSSLTDGEYSFRVTPVCDINRQDPANRQNPTKFVKGRIARIAPEIISTNPINGGVLTEGQITAEFNRAINPQTAVNTSFSLRGILGGVPQDLISAEFAEITDEVTIPHQSEFDLTEAFTVEMWVNPSTLPAAINVPILKKGNNYSIKLSPQGNIVVNDVATSSRRLQPLSWTHVAAVYDGVSTVTIYFNGVSVGSGTISALEANEDAIEIAKSDNGASFIGKLDEVRIWTVDRSPTEIVANLDKQLIGTEANLSAYFVFDDNALEGTSGAPNEAIRDYADNAVGTTEVGLSFVRGATNAAPLDITKLAKNLQYSIITSNNDTEVHIIPVFNASFIEGAQLTARVLNNRLQDPAGNKVKGESWSFIVNRNTIHWSQNNIRVSQIQGESTRITSIDLDNSEGGSPVSYRFRNLPSWLTVEKVQSTSVTRIEEGTENNLAAGFVERDLEFIVAPYLNPGTHSTDVYVEIFQRVDGREEPLGVEAFNLEVNVNCAVPNFAESFSSNAYLGEMNLTGQLMFAETQSLDTGDIVVAYLNGVYRGQANVGSNGLVNLSVFGNNNESGNLSFNVWDASECTEYRGIVENYVYTFRGAEGSVSSPITFTVGDRLTRRLSLVKNFQEVSFNVRDNNVSNNLSLGSIKGLTAGDRILDAITIEELVVVSENGTYVATGNIQNLDVRKAYIVDLRASKIIEIEGVPVPVDTDINIEGSRTLNAISYLPNNLQTVSLALRSLTSTTVSEGDVIRGRGLNAEYTSNGWVGSLTHLTPSIGYLYRATNSGVLNYSGLATIPQAEARGIADTTTEEQNSLEFLEKAKAINWEVNRNRYPSFMYMTANLSSDDLDEDREYIIAAFVNDEVRGVAKAELVDGEYRYFIGVGGFNREEVNFKLFNGEKVIKLDNIISFDRTSAKGNVSEPYNLIYTAKSNDDIDNLVNVGYSLSQNIPNPMKETTRITYSVPNDEFVDISLYNLLGQKVYTFVSGNVKGKRVHTINWNREASTISLQSGVYIYRLTSNNNVLTKKLIIKE